MYILSLHYNKQGLRKVAVCIYHHFIIKRKDEKKLQVCINHHFIITTKDEKSSSMYISLLHYNKEG